MSTYKFHLINLDEWLQHVDTLASSYWMQFNIKSFKGIKKDIKNILFHSMIHTMLNYKLSYSKPVIILENLKNSEIMCPFFNNWFENEEYEEKQKMIISLIKKIKKLNVIPFFVCNLLSCQLYPIILDYQGDGIEIDTKLNQLYHINTNSQYVQRYLKEHQLKHLDQYWFQPIERRYTWYSK